MRTITTSELEAVMQDKSMVLLDVRTAQEYAGGILKEHGFSRLTEFIPTRVKKVVRFT